MATIIVVAAVAVLFGLAVRHIVKQQKQGGCCGSCRNCSGCGGSCKGDRKY